MSLYDKNLEKNKGNYAPLTPVSLLTWVADVYPDRTAIVYGK